MNAADRRVAAAGVAVALRDRGIELLFGVPGGGTNLDILGAFCDAGGRFILTHTETAATIMAGTVGELTGIAGAAIVTRGPGLASALNGLAQALLDRQPLVLISDSVSASDAGRISHQRLDQRRVSAPVTKAALCCGTDTDRMTRAAVDAAMSDPPGPVHLDVDLGGVDADVAPDPSLQARSSASTVEIVSALKDAQRVVVLVGVGAVMVPAARRAAVVDAIGRFVERTGAIAFTTYKARGVCPDSAATTAGVLTGATIEAPALDEADLIVGIGLDPVELIPASWSYQAPMVLIGSWPVDDSTYFGDRLLAETWGDLATVLDQLDQPDQPDQLDQLDQLDQPDQPDEPASAQPTASARPTASPWPTGAGAAFRDAARDRLVSASASGTGTGMAPHEVVMLARSAAPPATTATVDAGAHMLVAVPLWTAEHPGELVISSGLATMGFSLPAAIAAALVHNRHVVCFTGDGGLGMVLAELETLGRLQLSVIVIVFNDASLSLIAAKQQVLGHGGDDAVRYRRMDFAGIAQACGVTGTRVDHTIAYQAALVAAFASRGPSLIDVTVDPSAYGSILDAVRGTRSPGDAGQVLGSGV